MPFELILPDIGEGVVEAEIQKWFVKPGDDVLEEAPLVEVMTDKATVTIPSPRRGRITRLHYREGEVAKVHEPLLEMDVGAPEHHPPVEAPSPESSPPPQAAATATERPAAEATPAALPARALATPAVRALARQLGVDVQRVRGTGPDGRVTRDDVAQASRRDGALRAGGREDAREGFPAERSEAGGAGALGAPQGPAEQGRGPDGSAGGEGGAPATTVSNRPASRVDAPSDDEVVPLRGIRRVIAERMARAKRSAAHFTFVEQVDVTELAKVKDRVAAAAGRQGVHVTLLPFIVKAAVASLRRHPWLNATLDEERGEVRLRRRYHIGIASATEHGLLVPVLRDADRLSLVALAREIDRLSRESKAGRARPEDLGGSTFTITSLGPRGGLLATPIINVPEVAILAVHRIRPTPVVREGEIVARDVMNVSLSFDHRVVDGDVGAAFAYTLIEYLEDPSLLFMELV